MSKILITGFSGFVGFHFLNYLSSTVNEKIDVLGIDMVEPPIFFGNFLDESNIKFLKINMLDGGALQKVIKDFNPNYIFHLAALSSVGKSWNEPAACFTNNTSIYLNIVETIRKEKLNTKLLCIGSSEEYGVFSETELPLQETLQVNPCNPYAVTKVAQEELTKCYVEKYRMNICLTRSFNHIGAYQKDTFVIPNFVKQVAQAFIDKRKKIELLTGNLDIIRDFLDVRDVVVAYYQILQKGKTGEVYNVCSGNGYALRDIIKMLSDISGLEITARINPELIRPNDISKIIGDNTKLLNDTGWKPVYSIKQSLQDIFEYWVKELSK